MTISIKLLQNDTQSGVGTRVFNDKGSEIKNITSIDIRIAPEEIITATVEVAIGDIKDMDNIKALLGVQTLQQIAALHGFRLERITTVGTRTAKGVVKD